MLNLCTNQNDNSAYQPDKDGCNTTAAPMIRLRSMLFAAGDCNESATLALRCCAPMDAVELDKQGYSFSYFESEKQTTRSTLSSLQALSIRKIAFFCDARGADFDVNDATQLAHKFNITLCKVVLPFHPTNMTCWDTWQWRIFDARLAMATGYRVLKSGENVGGQYNATPH